MDKQEWNGEGLPPVGVECEGHVPGASGKWRWVAVEVLMRKEHECAVHVPSLEVLRWCDEFRPIRSTEDKAIEAMIRCAGLDDDHWTRAICRGLCRAGYRKVEE